MIGCDLHSRQQTLAILDTETGVLEERVIEHDGNKVRDFYASLPRPARVGIEATGSMHWFLQLMEELEIECQVGHPAGSAPQNHVSRSMTDAMRSCCFDYSAKTAFPRSGCPYWTSAMCERC